MGDDFQTRADSDIARLLEYWREIEFWLKKAEQVNQAAIIPAINELRYASRQLIVAAGKLRQSSISALDQTQVTKRLTIAEQYLFNAEHDIIDSITTYYGRFLHELDQEVGPTAVTLLFPRYPIMKEKLHDCYRLISDARQDYDKRPQNYGQMKKDHLPFLINCYDGLTDAEVRARHQKEQAEAELVRARAKVGILEKIAVLGGLAGVIGLIAIPLSFYFWIVSKDEHCKRYSDIPMLNFACPRRTDVTQ